MSSLKRKVLWITEHSIYLCNTHTHTPYSAAWKYVNPLSSLEFSDCRRVYIYPRCCQIGLQLFRGDVWVGFYLIYYSSGASWWWSWWASTSRQSCGHVECPPFVNNLSYSGWMELESFGDGLIAFPRLMGCQYLLPDVPTWNHGKTTENSKLLKGFTYFQAALYIWNDWSYAVIQNLSLLS